MHSCTFSGETKSSATFIHDCPRTKKQLNKNCNARGTSSHLHTKVWHKKKSKSATVSVFHPTERAPGEQSYYTFKFLTWWGHPAGMKTASPRFCSNVHGSTPAYSVDKKTGSKSPKEKLSSKIHHYS
jgi:hypothetical protein